MLQGLVPGPEAQRVGFRCVEHPGVMDDHDLAAAGKKRRGVAEIDEGTATGRGRQLGLFPDMAARASDLTQLQARVGSGGLAFGVLDRARRCKDDCLRPLALFDEIVDGSCDLGREPLHPGHSLAKKTSIEENLRHRRTHRTCTWARVPETTRRGVRETGRSGAASSNMRAAAPMTHPSSRKKPRDEIMGADSRAATSWPQSAAEKPST